MSFESETLKHKFPRYNSAVINNTSCAYLENPWKHVALYDLTIEMWVVSSRCTIYPLEDHFMLLSVVYKSTAGNPIADFTLNVTPHCLLFIVSSSGIRWNRNCKLWEYLVDITSFCSFVFNFVAVEYCWVLELRV